MVCSSAEDRATFPRSCVKIYSIPLAKWVHVIRLRSRVHGIATSRNTLAVVRPAKAG